MKIGSRGIYRQIGTLPGLDTVAERDVFISRFSVGGEHIFKPFSSSSIHRQVAEQFAKTNGVMIIFKSKKGVYLNGLSVSPEESEVLFDRYTAVNVRAIYENKRYMIIEVVD